MLVHELSHDECVAVLRRNVVGRLGYARFDQPSIVPVYFAIDPDRPAIYGFATLGEKVESMRRNPRVCLEVDEIRDKNHWTTVLVIGRYREIHRDPREAADLQRAEALLRERDEWWLPGAAKLGSHAHDQAVMYRISMDRVTGRRVARGRDDVVALGAPA